ncbi:hypothetical protein CLAFUW4_10213 [Fulvia fulva]|uniref:Uncharacterized protein n=1 Tax=Passalora fulva TaxID=5499 RepID=A0A9Q8LFB2_PASFU|nr:uncharacterized protein CLAFUR5_04827 [Fulvia fulva]KAK4615490.1 hypothetical protein CLAFUR4_10217 [Fulvia fulva]KAK4616826.1 hypothetical protein CLAFUR0_10215 [Fulvia fulva]UJO16430.1 hypothetical protein CLAFUR5_04827 [Fulvia fulva]WPV19313.1 hypothetical protein CLAFUW4_10213 [Fulvia fulva]WPV34598.1 hypothetical protein CLAFUW7_10213 [Fulvia fulva]
MLLLRPVLRPLCEYQASPVAPTTYTYTTQASISINFTYNKIKIKNNITSNMSHIFDTSAILAAMPPPNHPNGPTPTDPPNS